MNLILFPLFDLAGKPYKIKDDVNNICLVRTSIILDDRTFPLYKNGSFIKFPKSKEESLTIGGKKTSLLTNGIMLIHSVDQDGILIRREIKGGAYGDKLCYLLAKDLKQIGFDLWPGKHESGTLTEDKLSINYLKSLPNETPVLTMLVT